MKKKIMWFLTIILSLSVFTACGESSQSTESTSDTTTKSEIEKTEEAIEETEELDPNDANTVDGEPIKLEVWSWDSVQGPGVQAAVDSYNENNPGVEVIYENIPSAGGNEDFMLKLEAAIEAGEGPDVFWLNVVSQDYAAAGAIECLDDYIANDSDFDLSIYSPAISEIHTHEDKQYGIPKDMDAWFIIYNKKLFDDAEIEYPTKDWTWDDMVTIAESLKDSLGEGQYPLYFNTSPTYGLCQLVTQNGGAYAIEENGELTPTFNSEEVKTAFTQLKSLQDDELAPSLTENPDFDSLTSLISGNLAMCTVPSWEIAAVAEIDPSGETFAAIPYPLNNGSNATDTNGLAYVMNSNSKNKDAAWDLIKFLTSDEGAKLHAENGAGIPANNNPDVKNAWVSSNSSIEDLAVVSEIADNSFLRPTTANPQLRPGLASVQENLYPQFFAGEITVDDLVEQGQIMIEDGMNQ